MFVRIAGGSSRDLVLRLVSGMRKRLFAAKTCWIYSVCPAVSLLCLSGSEKKQFQNPLKSTSLQQIQPKSTSQLQNRITTRNGYGCMISRTARQGTKRVLVMGQGWEVDTKQLPRRRSVVGIWRVNHRTNRVRVFLSGATAKSRWEPTSPVGTLTDVIITSRFDAAESHEPHFDRLVVHRRAPV